MYCLDQALGVSLSNVLNQLAKIIYRAALNSSTDQPEWGPASRAQTPIPDAFFAQLNLPRPRVLAATDARAFNLLYTFGPISYIYSVWRDLQDIARESVEWIRIARTRSPPEGSKEDFGWRWDLTASTLHPYIAKERSESARFDSFEYRTYKALNLIFITEHSNISSRRQGTI